MPRVGDMFPSRFLKESDVVEPKLYTVKSVTIEEIGRPGEEELKAVVHFEETEKQMTLNKTNAQRMEKALGSDNSDDWKGKQIVVYWDENVEYAGKMTGGIRVRGPKSQQAKEVPF